MKPIALVLLATAQFVLFGCASKKESLSELQRKPPPRAKAPYALKKKWASHPQPTPLPEEDPNANEKELASEPQPTPPEAVDPDANKKEAPYPSEKGLVGGTQAGPPPEEEPPPPPPPPEALPEQKPEFVEEKPAPPSKKFPRLATRGYLYTGQPTPRGYGAYAYVVFNANPQTVEKERCLAVCEAFNGYLPPTTQSHSVPERESQMVTFWPLSGSFTTDKPDCDRLIANYDHGFAARIAASVGKQGVRGPLLVAWTQPYGEVDSEALVLDMSHFATKDLPRAILKWKDRIAMNPAIWQRGWKAVVVKEEIRNTIENIGPGVVTVVATFFNKSKP